MSLLTQADVVDKSSNEKTLVVFLVLEELDMLWQHFLCAKLTFVEHAVFSEKPICSWNVVGSVLLLLFFLLESHCIFIIIIFCITPNTLVHVCHPPTPLGWKHHRSLFISRTL